MTNLVLSHLALVKALPSVCRCNTSFPYYKRAVRQPSALLQLLQVSYPLYYHAIVKDIVLQTKEKLQEFDRMDLCQENLRMV